MHSTTRQAVDAERVLTSTAMHNTTASLQSLLDDLTELLLPVCTNTSQDLPMHPYSVLVSMKVEEINNRFLTRP